MLHRLHRRMHRLVDRRKMRRHNHRRLRHRHQLQRHLAGQRQRSFAAAQHPRQARLPFGLVAHPAVGQIVQRIARVPAFHLALREGCTDGLHLPLHQPPHFAHRAAEQAASGLTLQPCLPRHLAQLGHRAVGQNHLHRHQVLPRRPIKNGVRTARVVAHHPTDHAAIRGRRIGSEHQPVRTQQPVEFIAHHTRLHPRLAPLHIDRHHPVQVAPRVDNQPRPNSLPRQARTGRPRRQRNPRRRACLHNLHQVRCALRQRNAERDQFVNARIRRIERPMHRIRSHLALHLRVELRKRLCHCNRQWRQCQLFA